MAQNNNNGYALNTGPIMSIGYESVKLFAKDGCSILL
jgi:hypothetical protein